MVKPVILDYLVIKTICAGDLVVVSPDVGGVTRARAFAKKLFDAPLTIIDKRRHGHNVAEVINLIGDVKGKVSVMVDDMIDTADISRGSQKLFRRLSKEVVVKTMAFWSWPELIMLQDGTAQPTAGDPTGKRSLMPIHLPCTPVRVISCMRTYFSKNCHSDRLRVNPEGMPCRSTKHASSQGYPVPAQAVEAGFISIQFSGNPSASDPNGLSSASPKLVEQVSSSDPHEISSRVSG